uniref:Uncharacterized protein n=1 Tax=Lotharella oceanica TaxID=641309 RepID=A0A7S2TVG3_9EUKA|mmetsp:Transcript_31646/g.59036  ORF Transcript_31646/g.59036 Transcript_31646/m.59036 type:complete len:211 (+) Transcript_31646:3-635(+)
MAALGLLLLGFSLREAAGSCVWSREKRFSSLEGIVDGVNVRFANVDEAKSACNEDERCHGVTKEIGDEVIYSLRSSATILWSLRGDSSWQKNCKQSSSLAGSLLASGSNSLVQGPLNIHQEKSPLYLTILILVPILLLAVSCTIIQAHTRNWAHYAWIWLRYFHSFALMPFKFGFRFGQTFMHRRERMNRHVPFDLDEEGLTGLPLFVRR